MKVQCDVCEKAEAGVMCCADEAALCAECDSRVHAANKLAGKHQRLNLLYPEPGDRPSCDICQDKSGYFFCLEDRALLCRNCDYSIHSTNALAAKHSRFLVSGARVTLHASLLAQHDDGQTMVSSGSPVPGLSPGPLAREKLNTHQQTEIRGTRVALSQSKESEQAMPMDASTEEVMVVIPSNLASVRVKPYNHQVHLNADWEMPPTLGGVHVNSMNAASALTSRQEVGNFTSTNSISEYLTETIPGWRVDELLSFTDTMSTSILNDCCTSKTNVWSYGDADWEVDYSLEDTISCQGFAEVPSIPSPPTLSGISQSPKTWGSVTPVKPSELDCLFEYDNVSIVPDVRITSSSAHLSTTSSQPQKRRRIASDLKKGKTNRQQLAS